MTFTILRSKNVIFGVAEKGLREEVLVVAVHSTEEPWRLLGGLVTYQRGNKQELR
uniref:Uncharacterized protein n=1 Tax=Solanum tuberosum TaxID=4113 RepID=M1BY01_SOLTU